MKRHWIASLMIMLTLLQLGGTVLAAISSSDLVSPLSNGSYTDFTTDGATGCHADETSDAVTIHSRHNAHSQAGTDSAECCRFECDCCVGGCGTTILTRAVTNNFPPRSPMTENYHRNPPLPPSFSFLKPPIPA